MSKLSIRKELEQMSETPKHPSPGCIDLTPLTEEIHQLRAKLEIAKRLLTEYYEAGTLEEQRDTDKRTHEFMLQFQVGRKEK
jgi:hypothetical protein